MTTMHLLQAAEVDIAYDLHGLLPTADGRPPVFLIGQPMDASGFATLVPTAPWSPTTRAAFGPRP